MDLIYDRTEADEQYIQALKETGWSKMTDGEKAFWLTEAGVKGMYFAPDYNRVGTAVSELRDILSNAGYYIDVSPKTDWAEGDIPTSEQLDTYLANVRALRAVLTLPSDTPTVPASMQGLDWQKANDIEKILAMLEAAIIRMKSILEFGWTQSTSYVGLYFGNFTHVITEDNKAILLENGEYLTVEMIANLPTAPSLAGGYMMLAQEAENIRFEVSQWAE